MSARHWLSVLGLSLLACLSAAAAPLVAHQPPSPPPAPPTAPPPSAPPHTAIRPAPRIDPQTGRDLANWPPDRNFDHLHMRLAIDIPSMDVPRLQGHETLTLRAIGRPRRTIRLDAKELDIQSVRVPGRRTSFRSDSRTLLIELDPPVRPGETIEVEIDYAAEYRQARSEGLTWTPGDPDGASETDRSPQIFSQGEAELNSLWFPCHDFPNERLSTELLVTVDGSYQVISNGRLIGRTPLDDGRATWHWLQDKPHANYLVTLVIGRFEAVELGGSDSDRPGLPMRVYAPIGQGAGAARVYARTPEMVATFERLFDEPYPWDKYDQVLVREFRFGGMENTSATTLDAQTATSEPGSEDDLISHELAHQWFGDLLTCRSWAHLWLNEGWATYAEALWAEADAGEGAGRDAYEQVIHDYLAQLIAVDRATSPADPAMVSNLYANPDDRFEMIDDPYAKGALILHMLRQRLGDKTFFGATRAYIDRFKFGLVETDDLRRVFEEVSGVSLERFFDQWARRPGIPRLEVTLEWNDATRALDVGVEQIQRIDADNPAYVFDLPVYVEVPGQPAQTVVVQVESSRSEASFALSDKPTLVTVDPHMSVAAEQRVVTSLALAPGSPPEASADAGDPSAEPGANVDPEP